MSERVVTTQAELDAALGAVDRVIIKSPAGVWLTITNNQSSRVVAWGSSSVEAWESSSVVAWGSSRVVARGSSSVEAWESSSVVAWGSSRVEAWGSSRVVAWGSSRVEAGPYVAVHLHSARVTLTGAGHVIDMTALNLADAEVWCAYHGVTVTDGIATLYKATDADYRTTAYVATSYAVGTDPVAADWEDTNRCGRGLHLGPTPRHARDYLPEAVHFLAVEVAVQSLRPITGGGTAKAKAPTCHVVREVDIDGREVSA